MAVRPIALENRERELTLRDRGPEAPMPAEDEREGLKKKRLERAEEAALKAEPHAGHHSQASWSQGAAAALAILKGGQAESKEAQASCRDCYSRGMDAAVAAYRAALAEP